MNTDVTGQTHRREHEGAEFTQRFPLRVQGKQYVAETMN